MPDKNDPEAAEAARLLNSRTTTNLTTVLPKEVKWNIDTECLIAVETSWLSHLMTAPRSLWEPGNYEPGETYQRLFRDVLTGRGVWPEDSGQDGKKGKSIALWISTVFEAQREALEQQDDRSDIDERTTDKWRNEQLEIEIQKAMDSILDQQRGDQGLRSYVTALVEYPEHHFSRKNKEFALKLLVRRIIQRGHGTSASRRRCNEWWKILREALKLANMESPPSSHPFFDFFPRYILYGILTASQLAAVQVICPNYLATLLASHSSLAFQKALLFVSLGLGLTTLDHLLALNTTSWRSQRRCKELCSSLQSLPTEDILALNTSQSSDWQLKMDQVRHRWGLGLPWWQYYPNRWLPSTSDPGSTLAAHATSSTFQQEDSESPPAYEAVMATSFSYRPPAYSSKISGLAADGSQSDGTGLPRSNQIPRLQDKPDERLVLTESQEIVGAVVLLDSPLSVNSLSKLLALSTEQLLQRVSSLHSVLSIPSDPTKPVQLCHLSLRNYLLDPRIRHETPYWVDEKQMHRKLAARCLSICDSLTRNICRLCDNTKRAQIDQWKIDHCFPPEVQYACRYWAHHLVQSYDHISDAPDILLFLKKHLLHWVEAMSILGFAFEVVRIIGLLQSVLHVDRGHDLSRFLHDAKRFILKYGQLADDVPLQIYSSSIFFAPERSIIRNQFQGEIPNWILMLSNPQRDWSAELQILEGHSDIVGSVAFSPNGRLLASGSRNFLGSSDKAFLVWNTATGALQPQRFEGHSNSVCSVAFSPDSRFLASVSDNTVQLWDAATGTLRRTLNGHQNPVHALAFSPDGRIIASGSGSQFGTTRDNSVRLWDVSTGALLHTLRNHQGPVNSVAFSPDGLLLAVASTSKIQIWDAATCVFQKTLEGDKTWIESVAFSPNGRLLASGSNSFLGRPNKALQLWDVATGTLQRTLECDSGTIHSVAFSPDGQLLASASADQIVRLWAVATGSLKRTFNGHSRSVKSVAFSPDGGLLASASFDNTVRLWDVSVGDVQPSLEGHSDLVRSVVFSPDGRLLLSTSDRGAVNLWNTATGDLQHSFESDSSSIRTVAFSPDSQLLATGSYGTVHLWDTATGDPQLTLDGIPSDVYCIAFSPSGRILAFGCIGIILICDTTTGDLQKTLTGHSWSVESVAFSPDGQLLASGSYDRTIRLWNPFTGVLQHTFQENFTSLDSLAFSPDGRILMFVSSNDAICLWDTLTGALLHGLHGHAAAFSPDGKILASASNDNTLRLWDVATGIPRETLEVKGRITDLEFCANGSYLCTNLGYIEIQPSPESLFPSLRPAANIFLEEEQWVTSHDGTALWLPPEYRPSCSAVKDNTLALGHASGRVSILKICNLYTLF